MAMIAAACGGGSSSVGTPVLGGTPIPTVERATATPPTCDIASPVDVPANFPSEFPIPEGFAATEVRTDPYLHVEGRVFYKGGGGGDPRQIAEREIINAIRDAWTTEVDSGVEGLQYTVTNMADGRQGKFGSYNVQFCPDHSYLFYDFYWITPTPGT